MIKLVSIIMGLIFASYTGFVCSPVTVETLYGADSPAGSMVSTQERKIYYSERIPDTYINPYKAPIFGAGKVNGCAVDVGGNTFVYFDRLYDDLVEDYTYTYALGKFSYGTQNDGVNNMFNDLYARMGSSNIGTSIDGFLNGMRSYASSRGHSINFEKVTGSYHNTNIVYIKEQLKQEKVAAIFLSGFSISSVSGPSKRNGYDYVLHNIYDVHHVMLVYGYADYNYFDGNGNHILRDTYFYVSTGYASMPRALLNICMLCDIEDMYIINVN